MARATERHLKIRLELFWWLFTAVLVIAVLVPIWLSGIAYPMYGINALYIVLFVTFTRYIFLFKLTLLARQTWLKYIIIASSAILIFVLIIKLVAFHRFIDDEGLLELVDHLKFERQIRLMQYIRSEVLFFGIGSIVAAVILPVRMLISIWRVRNTPDRV